MNPRPEWVVTVRMTGTSTETYLSATMPALIAGDVDPLLEPAKAASLFETHLAKPWRTCQ
jgi:hypothetical protein